MLCEIKQRASLHLSYAYQRALVSIKTVTTVLVEFDQFADLVEVLLNAVLKKHFCFNRLFFFSFFFSYFKETLFLSVFLFK